MHLQPKHRHLKVLCVLYAIATTIGVLSCEDEQAVAPANTTQKEIGAQAPAGVENNEGVLSGPADGGTPVDDTTDDPPAEPEPVVPEEEVVVEPWTDYSTRLSNHNASIVEKLNSCAFETPVDFEPSTQLELRLGSCETQCFLGADCSQVSRFMCDDSEALASLASCISECEESRMGSDFRCLNGAFIASEKKCNGVRDCEFGSDERNCEGGTYLSCGNDLLDTRLLCDGVKDCANAIDEKYCMQSQGPYFTCDDGNEIFQGQRCNGMPECPDGSDEDSCSFFFCDEREQVFEAFICDGFSNCDDETDEQDCPNLFSCGNGINITSRWVCDGQTDCNDGADEQSCPVWACEDGN